MLRLNHHTEVMAKHLTQRFVDLRGQGLTAKSLTKLTLDHMKRGFDVGAFMVVRQEFFAVLMVEVKHACPELRLLFPFRYADRIRFERNVRDRASLQRCQ